MHPSFTPPQPLPHDDPRDVMPLLLQGLCDRGAKCQPDNLIVTKVNGGYHSITYREHQARTRALASALTTWGARIGDRIATLLWNNAWHLQAYHAISCMGCVLHTLNARLSPKDQSFIIKHSGDRIVIVDSDLLSPLSQVDPDVLMRIELFVAVGEDGQPGAWKLPDEIPSAKVRDYERFLNSGKGVQYVWPDFPETAPHSLCYTSGTTGVPKGVTYSHRSTYLHTVVTMVGSDQYAISGSMVVNPYVPMFHVLSWGLPFATLMLGTRTIFTHRFNGPDVLVDTMMDWEVQLSTGVPLVWQGVRDEIMKRGLQDMAPRLAAFNTIISGGSAPPTDLMSWYFNELKVDFLQGWGMTETNPSGTFAKRVAFYSDLHKPLEEQFTNVTKAGIPSPGVEMRIARPDNLDEDMLQGETGELLVRGPWIITKYFQQHSPEKFHRGWLVTGDVAKFDKDGALILLDRSKDAIKSGGEWISSIDLENHISAMPEISSVVVLAQPHPKWEERPVAVVVLSREAGPDASTNILERVRSHCLGTYAKFQLPDDVLVWQELPLNGTGKLDKKAIRDRLLQEGYVLPTAKSFAEAKAKDQKPLPQVAPAAASHQASLQNHSKL